MKTLAITRPDGRVSVMHLSDDVEIDDHVQKWQQVTGMTATSVREIQPGDLPTSRAFRNAWADGGSGKLHVDMAGARAIKMEQIRAERNAALAASDVAMIKLIESDDTAGRVAMATKRQRLRDLPANVNLASLRTPEDLENYQPDELKG